MNAPRTSSRPRTAPITTREYSDRVQAEAERLAALPKYAHLFDPDELHAPHARRR